jgi:hypothetical protein
MEKEAVKLAKEHWKLTEIGGAYYVCVTKSITPPAAPVNPGETPKTTPMPISTTVIELRNAVVQVLPHSVNEAEKLNGTEWAGAVRLNADAHRTYRPRTFAGEQPDKAWSHWVSGGTEGARHSTYASRNPENDKEMDTVTVRKVKGQWEVVPPFQFGWSQDYTFKQVEPSDLPK